MTQKEVDQLAFEIIGCCIEVHKELGPGLLESIYEEALFFELTSKGYSVERQKEIEVIYKNNRLDKKHKLDLIVENSVIVELKSVKEFHPLYTAQTLSQMKLVKAPKGLLVNFNVTNIVKEGYKSFVNNYYNILPSN